MPEWAIPVMFYGMAVFIIAALIAEFRGTSGSGDAAAKRVTTPPADEVCLMPMTRAAAMAVIIPVLLCNAVVLTTSGAGAQDATPTVPYRCETTMTASPMAGTPPGAILELTGMDMSTSMDSVGAEVDQGYIDMMIPHHQSIIALAQAARDRLTDERLVAIAENIITTQQAEIDELRGYRAQFYGSSEPMPMDPTLPGSSAIMPDMEGMALLMDPKVLVATFCAGDDLDLAFIDLTLLHHQLAIMASEAALAQATHEEIRAVAERVMRDQQHEIDALIAIHQERAGEATPARS
jgi:uncharacterized protein (DUF305 family)